VYASSATSIANGSVYLRDPLRIYIQGIETHIADQLSGDSFAALVVAAVGGSCRACRPSTPNPECQLACLLLSRDFSLP